MILIRKIQAIVQRKYLEQCGGQLQKDDFTRVNAEATKKSLSQRDKVLIRASGESGRANIEITRDEYEEAISSLVAQTELLCESAIEEAGITITDINEVLLVGGSTRTPVIQQSVTNIFKKEPVTFGNPDEVVALGAAVYAAYKTDRQNLNAVQRTAVERIQISEITSKYFGVVSINYNEAQKKEELQNSIIIEKGERIPISRTNSYYTLHDGQTGVDCQITESNTPESDMNFVKIIWEGKLDLPDGRPAGQEIQVAFSYDENQVMHCSFVDAATNKRSEIKLSIDQSDTKNKVDINSFIVD